MNDDKKYLGNPLVVKRNKSSSFQSLIFKVKSRIMTWQIPLLSQAGKNTLIKSVVSAIPVYNMSVLQIPSKTIESIEKMFTKLFWGESTENKKLHTIKWSQICKSTEDGGLGIRDLGKNNLALLAKTSWQCLTNQDLFSSRVLKAKYCPK